MPETPETTTCKCSHSTDAHDAGECWAEVDGDRCGCVWYEANNQPKVESSAPAVKESLKAAPDDVPDELVKPAAEVLWRHYDSEYDAPHLTWKDFTGQARDILAAVRPAARRMYRLRAKLIAIRDRNQP